MASSVPKTESTIVELCSNVLLLALEIQKPGANLPDAKVLRERVKAELDELSKTAQKIGAGKSDIEDTKYALVATIDELLHFRQWEGKPAWEIHPLQVELFGERNAGVLFFQRLEGVRQRSREVLEVYFICLCLGFQGRFRVGGQQDLARIIDTLALELGHEKGPLSPRGLRTGPPPKTQRSFPLMPIAGATLGLAVMLAVSLFFMLNQVREETIAAMAVFGR